ncbi:MAG: VWA domain-containing protein [Ottowia sp.]|uniref:beta strand repeat-containing protein n=1 Tax=Ottowia sp. TaxID=1898956 RepID=UPI003C76DB65
MSVTSTQDTILESNETYNLTVGGASGTGTIVDNDALTVAISDAVSVNEGGNLVYTVSLSGGTSATPITIPLTYSGSATSGTDYTAGPATVTIPAGSTTATITLTTLTDLNTEGNETVIVTLGTLPANVTATDPIGQGTIIDVPPVPQVPQLVGVTSGIVSEEGLSGGLPDTAGTPTDTTNSASSTGTITFTDTDSPAGAMSVTLSGPAGITSGGTAVTWSWDAGTHTLTGSAGSTPVMTIAVGAVTGTGGSYSASYTATLLGPVDHPTGGNPGVEDVRSLGFSATVSDGVNTSTSANFSIAVEDDSPRAVNSSASTTVSPVDTNLMVILDVSGSMDYSSDVPGKTRLDLAKEAITNLINSYDGVGQLRVELITFSSSGSVQGTWLTAAAAIQVVNGLSAGGGTQYDDALETAMTGFSSGGKLTGAQNVSYFITDGEPSSGGSVDSSDESAWTTYLSNNKINSYALAVTNVSVNSINPIAYNGVTGVNTNGQVVANVSELDSVLQGIADIPVQEGNLLTGGVGGGAVGFGADGGRVAELTLDGTKYSYDYTNNTLTVVSGTNHSTWDATTNTATFTTSHGGTLALDFRTGEYEYRPSAQSGSNYGENLAYTVIDRDGDAASAVHTVNVTLMGRPTDDRVRADSTSVKILISDLLANDQVANPDYINLSNASGGTVSQSGDFVTFTFSSANGSFQYTVTDADGNTSSSATVILNRDGNGTGTSSSNTTINGTADGEILIGRDGVGDTINSGGGMDVIYGGTGDDTINAGQSVRLINGGDGTDMLNIGANFTSVSDAQIINIENITLTQSGTALNLSNQTEGFTITGSTGADTIIGGSGADKISAGGGNDTLTGGAGADQFIFNTNLSGGNNVDKITDFSSAEGDKIVLSRTNIFTNLPTSLTSAELLVVNNNGSSTNAGSAHLIYETSTGNLYYDSNGGSSGNRTLFATLGTTTSHPALTINDFMLI